MDQLHIYIFMRHKHTQSWRYQFTYFNCSIWIPSLIEIFSSAASDCSYSSNSTAERLNTFLRWSIDWLFDWRMMEEIRWPIKWDILQHGPAMVLHGKDDRLPLKPGDIFIHDLKTSSVFRRRRRWSRRGAADIHRLANRFVQIVQGRLWWTTTRYRCGQITTSEWQLMVFTCKVMRLGRWRGGL